MTVFKRVQKAFTFLKSSRFLNIVVTNLRTNPVPFKNFELVFELVSNLKLFYSCPGRIGTHLSYHTHQHDF